MKDFEAGRENRIELKVTLQLAKGKVGRLKGKYTPIWTNEVCQMKRMRAYVGTYVEHKRRGLHQLAQGKRSSSLEFSKVNCQIDTLCHIQIVGDAFPDNDLPIASTKKRSRAMNDTI